MRKTFVAYFCRKKASSYPSTSVLLWEHRDARTLKKCVAVNRRTRAGGFPKEVEGVEPFLVGCWEGSTKPEVGEYLEQTVSELLELDTCGIAKLDSMVADSPARAFGLRIAYPGGAHACPRCWIRGISISIRKGGNIVVHKVVYPGGCCRARLRNH